MIRSKNSECGSTMLETIMYVGFLGMLGAVLAGYVGDVFKRYKIGRINQQIIDLKKAIVHFTAANEDYTKLTLQDMLSSKAMPLDMRDSRHATGGSIELGPVGDGSTNPNEKFLFYVTFNELDRQTCIELLTQGQFYGDGSDMDTVIVNNTTAWTFRRSFYTLGSIPKIHYLDQNDSMLLNAKPSVIDAGAACAAGKNNTIKWIFS